MSGPASLEPLPPAQLGEQLSRLEEEVLSQPQQTRPRVLELWQQAQALDYRPQQAFALLLLAIGDFLQGEYLSAMPHAEQALDLARDLGDVRLESRLLNLIATSRGRLGQYDQAMEAFMQSLKLALDEGDDLARCRVLINMAVIHERLDDLQQALDLFRSGLELAQKQGHMTYASDALAGMIGVLGQMGRYRESQRLVARALHWARTHRFPRAECTVLYHQAINLLALGDPEPARASAEQCLKLAESIGDREALVEGSQILGEVLLALGDLTGAQERLSWSEAEAQVLGAQAMECRAKAGLSRLFERRGQYRQALKYVRAQQAIESGVRSRMIEQRAMVLAGQIRVEVLQRESELQRERNAELARANSTLRQTQVELTRRASQDQLTGLANRAFFWSRVQKALEHLSPGRSLGLIFADIDHLKAINDRYGHAGGDRLIAELAHRMRATVRSGDLVGRLSGDEFMILLGDMSSHDDIDIIAQKLLTALREPLEFQGQQIAPTLSLGCVVAPEDGISMETLHKHADLALYQAKAQGRNMAVRFAPHMSAEEQDRRQLEQDLRSAVRSGQLELHYQGQFVLPSRQLSGFEALVRWRHPQRGMIPPDRFISLAEESRLILDLGQWVMDEACRQAREWKVAERGLTVAVNVSALQFEQPDFVRSVQACLERHGLPGTCLTVELTESMVHHDPAQAAASVSQLQALGVKIAMDDFGTGYSSLSMLKNLPFEQLKIDREFLHDLYHESEQFAAAQQFIEVIVSFAHNLQMRVLAEGVETEEQYELLSAMGCDEAQGYWLARPQPPADAARLLPPLP